MKRILLLVLVVAFCIPLFAMQAPPKKAENKQIAATENTENLKKVMPKRHLQEEINQKMFWQVIRNLTETTGSL